MIKPNTISQMQNAPIEERIQIIEILLQSVKHDLHFTPLRKTPYRKPFQVRTFHLGRDVHVDRDDIYADVKDFSYV